jgi:hypothetical protein
MRQVIAFVVAFALMVGMVAPAADAGGTDTSVALGLASFAVFNQLVGPLLNRGPHYWEHEVVVARPVYAPASQVVVGQSVPTDPPVVQYPNGRELHGNGVYTPYHWIWVPSVPQLPPLPPPPPAS